MQPLSNKKVIQPYANDPTIDFLLAGADPAHFMEAAFNAKPDPWQKDFLRTKERKVILLCHRQSGKSFSTATKALHHAAYFPGAHVLIFSRRKRQSVETFRKIKKGLWFLRLGGIKCVHDTQIMVQLSNGSIIEALPGVEQDIRGYSATLLIFDEASRVLDELYYSTRPMLATTGGQTIALSTPFGQRGWFHNAWTTGEDWERFNVTVDSEYRSPRVTDEFLEEERREIGEWWYEQEYLCKFQGSGNQIFTHEMIMNAFTTKVKAIEV
jgi:hypothetical protein